MKVMYSLPVRLDDILKPNYLVYEFITTSLEQLSEYINLKV
jgi:hypothetical protein